MSNWFVFSLVSAFGFGLIPLLLKSLEQTYSPQIIMAWYYSLVAIFLWIFSFFTTKLSFPSLKNSGTVLILSILAAVADLAILYAYKYASNAGYPRSIQAFSIVIATILSALVFRQFPSTIGIIGVLFIFIGVVLLSGIK